MADLAQAVAELAGYLRYQRLLGVAGLALSAPARQALRRLDKIVPPPPAPAAGATRRPPGEPLSLSEAAAQAQACARCALAQGRRSVVFGEGPERVRLLFVGEAPGEDEDLAGRPFVGPAGQLLTKIITAMGLAREQVYITNTVKCRPPRNRDPRPEELAACRPFLEAQLAALRPEVVVALGRCAAQALLGSERPIGQLRGRFHDFRGTPLMPTFHPSYLLRQNEDRRLKGQVWADMKLVLARLGLRAPSS